MDVSEERQLLGALILDPSLQARLPEIIPDLFALAAHRVIFSAMLEIVSGSADGPACLCYQCILNSLRASGNFTHLGEAGVTYVCTLHDGVVIECAFDLRLKRLRLLAQRRKLMLLAAGLAEKAPDPTLQAGEIAQWALTQITEAGALTR